MPHIPKQKISKKQRAVKRARLSRQRKREKDEFAHIEYLKTQLDDKGRPLDILHTDEELLNNEQKFIVRIMNELSKFDPLSITNLIDDYYDDDVIDEIVDYYYQNKQNKSWSDRLFKATYNCLRITNLTYLLKNDVLSHMDELFITFSEREAESTRYILTEDIMLDIIEKSKSDIHDELNMAEIINSLLLVYVQNVQMCYLNELGGKKSKIIQSGGSIVMLLLIFLIMVLSWFLLKENKSKTNIEVKQGPRPPSAEEMSILNMKIERDRQRKLAQIVENKVDVSMRPQPNAQDYADVELFRKNNPHNLQQPTAEDFAILRMKIERDKKKAAQQELSNSENKNDDK